MRVNNLDLVPKDEIIEELSEKYDVTKSMLFIDVSDFLTKLNIYGLLK